MKAAAPGPESAPTRVIPLLLLLVVSVGAFVLALGLAAFLTRNPSTSASGSTGDDVDAGVQDAGPDPGHEGWFGPPVVDEARVARARARLLERRRARGAQLLEALKPAVAECIERARVRDPAAGSKARFRIAYSIAADRGSVDLVEIESSPSPFFDPCFLGRARGWTTDLPAEAVDASEAPTTQPLEPFSERIEIKVAVSQGEGVRVERVRSP